MNTEPSVQAPVDLTETLLKLYTSLMQHLDGALSESARAASVDGDLRRRVASAQEEVLQLLAANRVVRHKVEDECAGILSLAARCLVDGPGETAALDELRAVRAVLKIKILTLSDLLAVFRAT